MKKQKDDYTKEFEDQGFGESYIRDVLLPHTGLKGYKGPIRRSVQPLVGIKNIGIETKLYDFTVFGGKREKNNGKVVRGFIVKDHANIEDSIVLYGNEVRPSKDRYETEKQILSLLGDEGIGPRLISSDGRMRRLFIQRWDCSLDELLDCTYNEYSVEKNLLKKRRLKKKALSYVNSSIMSSIASCSVLTNALPLLEETALEVEKTHIKGRRNKLGKQLHAILERSLKYQPNEKRLAEVKELEERLNNDRGLRQELSDLARYLVKGRQVIHNDARSPNFIIRVRPDLLKKADYKIRDELPSSDELQFAPCDYTDIRKGPVSHDIGTLVNDPYILRFNLEKKDRKKLFRNGLKKAESLLELTEREYAFLDNGVNFLPKKEWKKFSGKEFEKKAKEYNENQFLISSTANLISKLANSIEIENSDENLYREFLEHHPFEDNSIKMLISLKYLIDQTLWGTKEFINIRGILSKAHKRLEEEEETREIKAEYLPRYIYNPKRR